MNVWDRIVQSILNLDWQCNCNPLALSISTYLLHYISHLPNIISLPQPVIRLRIPSDLTNTTYCRQKESWWLLCKCCENFSRDRILWLATSKLQSSTHRKHIRYCINFCKSLLTTIFKNLLNTSFCNENTKQSKVPNTIAQTWSKNIIIFL